MALHALGALIAGVQQANDWSDADLVARARRHGHNLSKANISRVRNDRPIAIRGSLLVALADALDIPLRQVVQAALQSMDLPGLRDFSTTTPEAAIRLDTEISAREKAMLLAMFKVLRSSEGKVIPMPRRAEKRDEFEFDEDDAVAAHEPEDDFEDEQEGFEESP